MSPQLSKTDGPRPTISVTVDPEDKEYLEHLEDNHPLIDNKSEAVRYAIKAMKLRGAMATLQEIEENGSGA